MNEANEANGMGRGANDSNTSTYTVTIFFLRRLSGLLKRWKE